MTMETRANYVLIGVFTLAGALLAVGVALWSVRYTTTAQWADYEIRFSQAVTGLATGSSVQYNGIHVGTVRELFLAPDDPRQVIAHIRIQADAPVREDTVARLTVAGLTGTSFIQLSGGSPDSPPARAAPGQAMPSIPAEESALARLIGASEGITDTANELLLRMIEVLSDENAERIGGTLANLEVLTAGLAADREHMGDALNRVAQASARIDGVLAGADETFRTMTTVLNRLDEGLVARLPEIADDAGAALRQFSALSARADAVLEANAGSLARFGSEGLGQLGPTLQELRVLLQDLSRVARRIDRDPAQFLLGGRQPEEYPTP
jgi:phospholipid/cholesterol/gamma-HCH transport system substrate-binding protein